MDHMLYSEIVASIDSVAQRVQDKGLLKEATSLDMIANTLEKEAGLTDAVKKGMGALKNMGNLIPADLKSKLQGKSLPEILKGITNKLTGGKDILNKELFDQIMSAAGAAHGIYPDHSGREAGAIKDTLAKVFVGVLAAILGKDAKDLTFEDYKKVASSLESMIMTQTGK